MQTQEIVCRGKYRRAKLDGYIQTMSTPDDKVLWNTTVAHILEEQGFYIKEDPRSIYDPSQLYTALERYSPKYDTFVNQSDPHLKQGIAMAWSVYSKPKDRNYLKVLRTFDELSVATKGEKFAGLPSMGKKRDDIVYALDREKQVKDGIKTPSPCLAGKRTQRGNKTRLVWMYPYEMTLMEARFARPLIDTFLDRRTTMAFGMTKVEIGALVDSISFHSNGRPVAMDYSKFDSSIPSYLIKQAFKILSTWFSPEDRKEFGYEIVEKYFLHTPIVMPDGNLYTGKKHGVPSGSYFTQMIDSIVNTILLGSMSSAHQLGLQWKKMLVLGDDVLICMINPKLEEIRAYLLTFGIVLNLEKTKFEPHFLGATWNFGKPTRRLDELLSMAVQPETFKHMGDTDKERRFNGLSLLMNYSSTYVNAWRMLNGIVRVPRHMNLWDLKIEPKYMSGSDRFFVEYQQKENSIGDSRPTLIKRFLA